MLPTPSLRTRAPPALSLTLAVTAAPAAAQSLLERVLDSIRIDAGLTQVSGIFVNTADSIGVPERTVTESAPNERELVRTLEVGDVILVRFLLLPDGPVEFLAKVEDDKSLSYFDDTVGTAGDVFTQVGTAISAIGAPLFEGPDGVLTVEGSTLAPEFDNISGFAGLPFATTTTSDPTLSAGDVILVNIFGDEFLVVVAPDGSLFFAQDFGVPGGSTGSRFSPAGLKVAEIGASLFEGPGGVVTVGLESLFAGPFQAVSGFDDFVALQATTEIVTTIPGRSLEIDASITNILTGVAAQAATTAGVSVTEPVTALIGNLSTTALGAVNTGEIELLGANLGVAETIDTAVAGSSAAIREIVDNTVTQVGSEVGATVLALNSALNDGNVNASVTNITQGVTTSIGINEGMAGQFDSAALTALFGNAGDLGEAGTVFAAADIANIVGEIAGGIETTALGAVNTGEITSGVSEQVNGVVTSIVGNAATNVD